MRLCIISPEASQDLDEIFDYFADKNVDAGEQFVLDFEQKCQKLLQFPYIGKSYPEINPSLRGLPLKNYIIFYRLLNDNIEIIRVVSGYRNLKSFSSNKD